MTESRSSCCRVRSPGRAHCQLNYPRDEEVVKLIMLDKVKAARKEVVEHISADVMGVRGPQWTCSSHLQDSKYTRLTSDTHLANQVLVSRWCQSDLRRSKSPPRCRYDTHHYHAFTRGDAATGWNHSTELPSRRQQGKQLQRLDSKAQAATAKQRLQLARYVPPVKRHEVLAEAKRQQKQDADAKAAALLKQYGPEGAAAMQQILTMKKPNRPYFHIKASKEDIQAVLQLPVSGLAERDEQ